MDLINQRKPESNALDILCTDSLSLKAKIATFSFLAEPYFKGFDIITLIFEYLQLVSQILFLHISSDDSVFSESPITAAVVYILKVFNPGYLLIFDGQTDLTFCVIIITLLYSLTRYMLFGYVVLVAYFGNTPISFLIKLWKVIFRLQGRILYFVITSFWQTVALQTLQNRSDIFGLGTWRTLALFMTLTTTEYIFSLFLNISYCSPLPSKDFLSTKSRQTQILSLTQKFAVQIFQIILCSHPSLNHLIFSSMSIIFSIARNINFFKTLPLYHYQALFYQGTLLMIVTSVDIACFAQNINSTLDSEKSMNFTLIIWSSLAILMIKMSHAFLKKLSTDIITMDFKHNPYLMIHKISAIKYIQKLARAPTEFSQKCEYEYIIFTSLNSNLELISKPNSNNAQINEKMNLKELVDRHFQHYLEDLQESFPKNDFIKLYLAYFYAKKLKLYGIAMKLLTELQHSSSQNILLSTSLLILDIQHLIRSDLSKQSNGIDLYSFFTTQIRFSEIKKKMIVHAELQGDLYQELTIDRPDLAKIFNHGQVINQYRDTIEKETTLLIKDMPDCYLEPLLLSAEYQSTLNYSSKNAKEYSRIYSHKLRKYEKSLNSENIIPENIYQENTAFIVLSGQKENLGRIIYSTNSLSKILGGDSGLYQGINISSIILFNFNDFCSEFFESKLIQQDQKKKFSSQLFQVYAFHKEGYLTEVDIYLDVFPFLTQGLNFCLLIRPALCKKEYMLVHENGDIEGATKALGIDLCLNKNHNPSGSKVLFNIRQVSEELYHINNVMNIFHSLNNSATTEYSKNSLQSPINRQRRNSSKLTSWAKESNQNIDMLEAKELYSILSTEGKDISIYPLIPAEGEKVRNFRAKEKDSLVYNCTVKTISQKSALMKLIILEAKNKVNIETHLEDKKEEDEDDDIRSEQNSDEVSEELDRIEIPKAWYPYKLNRIDNKTEIATNMVQIEFPSTEGNILSPKSHDRLLTNQTITLFSASPQSKPIQKQHSADRYLSNSTLQDNEIDILQEVDTSKAGQYSNSSQKLKLPSSIDLSLTTKYYPKSVILFCLLFYALLVAILGIQIYRRISLDTTIRNLKAKKELLRTSQRRDYLLINTHQNLRCLQDISVGTINSSDFGALSYLTTYDFSNSTRSSLFALSQVNQNLMEKAEVISEEVRNELFQQNVQINDTNLNNGQQTLLNFTAFQATNQIVEVGFKFMGAGDMNTLERGEALEFIFQNTVNDLLLKTELTSDLFFESIGTVIEQRRAKTIDYMNSRIILLVVTFLILTGIARKKYQEEKTQLQALVRLENREVMSLQEKIAEFRASLETENLKESKVLLKFMKNSKKLATSTKKHDLKRHRQDPNDKRLLRKYVLYLGEAFVIFCILIAFLIWISLSAITSNEVLKVEQGKLYFADNMIITINLAFLISQELYATNDSASILNIDISTGLKNIISDLSALRNNAMNELSYEDKSYDPIVESILFDNGCQFLSSNSMNYCAILEGKAWKTNFISLLSNYEALMQEKLEAFGVSSGTTESLKIERMRDFDIIWSLLKVLGDESSLMASRINQNFEAQFIDLGNKRNLLSDIFYIAIVLSAIVSWILVLRRLINADNKFKIVLRAFPSSLIVSNFILKSFLVKTSGGALSHKKLEV